MAELVRQGTGPPLLLVHGLGSSMRSWEPILPELAQSREVITFDLPGHGRTPAEPDSGTFAGLARSLEALLDQGLDGVDIVGASLGARLALEMARRGRVGAAVALAPGGFWRGWERAFFGWTVGPSVRLVRALRPATPALSRNALARSLLMIQFSARPWRLDPTLVETELRTLGTTPTATALVRDLARGPEQQGPAAPSSGRVTIGWGRQDRLCLPRQAARAQAAFPTARLHWFDACGHLPAWDQPQATARLILTNTG
jgi:pimeloyl-ACP methyl ester carboxylesterase